MGKYIFYLCLFVFVVNIGCNTPKKIFNENNQDWITNGNANWNFDKNTLVGSLENGAGFIITKNRYKDFILELDFYPDSTINSGVFVRCKTDKIDQYDCYELNIWDINPNQDNRTGSLVRRIKPINTVHTIHKWNTYKIKCQGNHVQAWINGIITSDTIDDSLKDGLIAIQAAENGKILFKNVQIKTIQ